MNPRSVSAGPETRRIRGAKHSTVSGELILKVLSRLNGNKTWTQLPIHLRLDALGSRWPARSRGLRSEREQQEAQQRCGGLRGAQRGSNDPVIIRSKCPRACNVQGERCRRIMQCWSVIDEERERESKREGEGEVKSRGE